MGLRRFHNWVGRMHEKSLVQHREGCDNFEQVRERLRAISKLYQSRPVKVTDELIAWCNPQDRGQ